MEEEHGAATGEREGPVWSKIHGIEARLRDLWGQVKRLAEDVRELQTYRQTQGAQLGNLWEEVRRMRRALSVVVLELLVLALSALGFLAWQILSRGV